MDVTTLLAQSPGIMIGGFKIHAYAIIIVCGMISAFFVISALFKRRNMSPDLFLTFFCVCLPVAIITTRLFYCITDGMPISEWFAIDSIRKGGLSIMGGILGGVISVALVCIIKKVNFFRVGDCIVVGLLLAQAIGRWGNFANQEVYGTEITNEALHFFPIGVYINESGNCMQTVTLTFSKLFGFETDITGGTWHYAFFLYESIITLSAAIALFIHAWKNPKKPNGINTALYFAVYGLTRSIMEPLRDSSFILGESIPWSMVTSILLCLGGVGLLIYLLVRNKQKEGAFIGSLNGDPYGITDYIGDYKREIAYYTDINMMCKIYPERYEKKTDAKNKNTSKNEENKTEEIEK
ncbi:MAG: prolipoprotein diacylglyceryl transferase [Clostridiales bacterium]|nr:prolipoprotein diacylglyceryl transferase [Clostridiales bacterium]